MRAVIRFVVQVSGLFPGWNPGGGLQIFEIVRLSPAFLFRLGFAEPPKLLYDCHRQSLLLEDSLRSAALPGGRCCVGGPVEAFGYSKTLGYLPHSSSAPSGHLPPRGTGRYALLPSGLVRWWAVGLDTRKGCPYDVVPGCGCNS